MKRRTLILQFRIELIRDTVANVTASSAPAVTPSIVPVDDQGLAFGAFEGRESLAELAEGSALAVEDAVDAEGSDELDPEVVDDAAGSPSVTVTITMGLTR